MGCARLGNWLEVLAKSNAIRAGLSIVKLKGLTASSDMLNVTWMRLPGSDAYCIDSIVFCAAIATLEPILALTENAITSSLFNRPPVMPLV
jgi:hypothetical protein